VLPRRTMMSFSDVCGVSDGTVDAADRSDEYRPLGRSEPGSRGLKASPPCILRAAGESAGGNCGELGTNLSTVEAGRTGRPSAPTKWPAVPNLVQTGEESISLGQQLPDPVPQRFQGTSRRRASSLFSVLSLGAARCDHPRLLLVRS